MRRCAWIVIVLLLLAWCNAERRVAAANERAAEAEAWAEAVEAEAELWVSKAGGNR